VIEQDPMVLVSRFDELRVHEQISRVKRSITPPAGVEESYRGDRVYGRVRSSLRPRRR
jgi:hypothetical protein